MSEVIEARNIKLDVDASDWRDSMVKSGQLLVDSDYITKDYIDLTIKCVEENGPYIVIIPGLALSHSRPDVSVNKTGLSLITLSKPVCFDCDNDPVDIVLTLQQLTTHLICRNFSPWLSLFQMKRTLNSLKTQNQLRKLPKRSMNLNQKSKKGERGWKY